MAHIPDEAAAVFMYGKDWHKKIVALPEEYSLFYEECVVVGDAVSSCQDILSLIEQALCLCNHLS